MSEHEPATSCEGPLKVLMHLMEHPNGSISPDIAESIGSEPRYVQRWLRALRKHGWAEPVSRTEARGKSNGHVIWAVDVTVSRRYFDANRNLFRYMEEYLSQAERPV